jgi:hypothetical protein
MAGNALRNGLIGLFVIVIIAVAVYFLFFSSSGTIAISGPTKIKIGSQPTLIKVGGLDYGVELASSNENAGKANLYVHSIPVFSGSTYNVTIRLNSTTHVAIGMNYSNMGIILDNVTAGYAVVTIFPIQQYADTPPDSNEISSVSESLVLGNHGSTGGGSTVATTTIKATTTIASSGSTTTTTIPVTTTIKPSGNATLEKIYAIANQTLYYPLLLNYSKLYAAESSCTPTLYASSYENLYGSSPTGSYTYINVKNQVPYNLSVNLTNAGGNIYKIIFYGHINITTLNDKPAATITVNLNTSVAGITFSNIFYGANYTTLHSGYVSAELVGNGCGAYLMS